MKYQVKLEIKNGSSDKDSIIDIKVIKDSATPAQNVQSNAIIDIPLVEEFARVLHDIRSQDSVSLNIDISDVADVDLDVERIRRILDKYINLKDIKIICQQSVVENTSKSVEDKRDNQTPKEEKQASPQVERIEPANNEAPKQLTKSQLLQNCANEITARNQLINILGVDTRGDSFDPWVDLMATYLNSHYCSINHMDITTLSYFTNRVSGRVEDNINIVELLTQIGKSGFAAFITVLYSSVRSQNLKLFRSRFIFSNPRIYKKDLALNTCEIIDIAVLNTCEILEILLKAQEDFKVAFPFDNLIINAALSEDESINQRLSDLLVKFAKLNPHVSYIEIHGPKNNQKQKPQIIDTFLDAVKIERLTTSFDIGTLENKQKEALENIALQNRILLETSKTKSNISETATNSDYFEPVGVPPSWLKPRPEFNSQEKLTVQYEHTVTRTVHQSNSTDTFAARSMQRIQQIQNQQQRQKQLMSEGNKKVDLSQLRNVVDRESVKNLKNAISDSLRDALTDDAKHIYLVETWDNIVGKKIKAIDKISKDAMKVILDFPEAFLGGIISHNLPEGFYIGEYNNEKILCHEKVARKKQVKTYLTAPLRDARNELITIGSKEQFDHQVVPERRKDPDFEKLNAAFLSFVADRIDYDNPKEPRIERKAALLIILKLISPENEVKLRERYMSVLNTFTQNNLNALRIILTEHGPSKLIAFFNKLKLLQDKGLYESFKLAFMDTISNWNDLASDDSFAAMDKLYQLDVNQANWWIELTTQQAKHQKVLKPSQNASIKSNVVDMVAAFDYFCAEVKKLDPTIALPNPCLIKDIKNAHVVLDRLLYILKNSADPKEQLYNLEGVSLDHEAAYYAVRNDGYNFVCSEMELTVDKITEVPNKKPTYKITKEDLCRVAAARSVTEFKTLFFRFLGLQKYTYPFSIYRKIFDHIVYYPTPESTEVTRATENILLAVIAIATTDERSLRYDPQPSIDEIFRHVNHVQQRERYNLMTRINVLCSQGLKPDVYELLGITKYLVNSDLEDVVRLSIDYKDLFKEYGTSLAKTLANCGHREDVFELSALRLLLDKLLEKNTLNTNNQLMGKILAILGSLHFTADHVELLVSKITSFLPTHADQLNNLLDVLNDMNVTEEHSAHLPDITIFDPALITDASKSGIKQLVLRNFPRVNFSQQSLAMYGEDCKSELIVLLRDEEVKQYLPHIGLNSEQLIKELCARADAITVDDLLAKLNDNLNKIFLVGGYLKVIVIKKFISASINNAFSLIKGLELPEPLANRLIQNLTSYIGFVDKDSEAEAVRSFVARIQKIKHLLVGLNKNKSDKINECISNLISEKINSCITKLISELEGNKQSKDLIINRFAHIFSDRKFNFQQRALIYDQLTDIDSADTLYNRILEVVDALGINSFDFIMSSLDKCQEGSAKIEQCTVIKQLVTLIGKNYKDFKEFSVFELAKPLLEKFAASQNHFNFIFEVLEQKQEQIIPEFFVIINTLLINSKEDDLFQLTPKLKLLINRLLSFDEANKQNGNYIRTLALLFKHRPFPTLDSLSTSVTVQNNSIESICTKADSDPWGNRNSNRQLKFDDDDKKHITEQIYKITDLVRFDGLTKDTMNDLYVKYKLITNLGRKIAYYNREKLLVEFNNTKAQMPRLLNSLAELRNIKVSAENKKELEETKKLLNDTIFITRANLLAYLREIYYRTSIAVGNPPDGKFPDATQTIAVLHSIQTGSNALLGIDTEQGKATSTALQNAMLWCEGHTVNSCSNNMDNATRDKNEHEDFYHYIGADVAVIDDETEVGKITNNVYEGPYKEHAIHYSTRTKLGLYRDKCALEGIDFRKLFKTPISLNYDEFDSAALDDTSQTILSEGSSSADPFDNPDKWIYPLVNRFVDFLDKKSLDETEKLFIQDCFRAVKDKYTIAEEVFALREYLYKRAAHEDKPRLTDKLIHLQLNSWIKAARKARILFEDNSGDQKDKDFSIEIEKRTVNGSDVYFSKATIMEGGFPNYSARWQNGVQQLLHARLNENLAVNEPEFICEPQRKVQASATSKNFFDYYIKDTTPGSRILGQTATPGSEDIEIPELSEDYQLQIHKMPPHQKSNRKTLKPIYGKNLDDQIRKLANVFRKEESHGNHGPAPILICCADIPAAEAVAQKLRAQNLPHYQVNVLTGKMTQEQRKALTDNAGQPITLDGVIKGRVTISTISGIGTNIKTQHPEGLLTCGTHVTTYRKEKQQDGRSGRRGQKGRVIHTYNDEAILRDFGVTLSDKPPEEIQEIMKNIQDGLDLNNQRNRRKINRAGDIACLVQDQLNQCYQFLLNSGNPNLEKLKEDFTKIRQYIVEDLSKTWDEMLSDIVANHPMTPEEKLNHVTEEYIKFVNKLWIRKSHELLQLGIPQQLLKFKVEDHLAKNKPQKIDYTTHKSSDDKYVKTFKDHLDKPKNKVVNLVQFFRNTANSKLVHKKGTANVLAYQHENSAEMLIDAKNYVESALNEYKKLWGMGSDRRECLEYLLTFGNHKITDQSNFVSLISRLNETSLNTFSTDCTKNQSWNPFAHRSTSRLRNEVIFKSKMHIYSVCPPAELENVAKQDLMDLRKYLDHNLQYNPYYAKQSDVKELLSNFVNMLPSGQAAFINTSEKLAKAITELRRIINTADYNDKISGLLEITVALDYLYRRLNCIVELKDDQYQHTYKSVQNALAKIDIKEPSYFSSLFSNPFDIPDNINFFTDVLGTHADRKIANPKERFHVYQVMVQVQEKLTGIKFGAHNIEFKYDKAQLKVNFYLTDPKTYATSHNEILIHIDMKNKTYIPEPVVTAAVHAPQIPARQV